MLADEHRLGWVRSRSRLGRTVPRRALTGVALAAACVGLVGCEPHDLVLDQTYGGDGFADISEQVSSISPHAFEVAGDGSIVTVLGGQLTRVLPNGTIDPTFTAVTPAGGAVRAAAIDASGRILTFQHGSTSGQLTVRRFTANGTPDPSFDGDGARTIALTYEGSPADVQSDHAGRIVVLFGNIPQPGPETTCQVLRLLPNGSVDPAFGGGLPVALDLPYSISTGAGCNELLVLDDDTLLVVDTDAGIARLSSTGAQLPYGPGPAAFLADSYDGIVDAALLPGGRIAVGTSNYDSGDYRAMVAELTATGGLDPGFGTGGIAIVGFVDLSSAPDNLDYTRLSWLSTTPDGSLVAVAGHSTGVGVARWVDGHLDSGFGSAGRVLVEGPLPYPRDLSNPVTGGVAADGTLYVISNRQGALAPLSLVHLAAPPGSRPRASDVRGVLHRPPPQ